MKHIIIWTQFLEDNEDNMVVDESLLQEMNGLKLRMKRMKDVVQIKDYTCDEHQVTYGSTESLYSILENNITL